ncbi:beta strand repeat-containing protein [Abyssalbus ytuae]|uniref:Right-handed parallel beta-helix repeat-containing protein n=1 Tax=Abyssalbus ytuae TaxID=2926907 RepID=A0A9E6ZLL9_9FLAO|nr:SdrD B-like domain-containing protein [Abyssalbus ytuae]UOB16879.1 right-handed parallel beta-helix repeat-containing protein [Abyssalbus ytuae]
MRRLHAYLKTFIKINNLTALFLINALIVMQESYSQETFGDDFETVSYGNNTGTLNFTGDWIEVNETTNSTTGKITITSNQLRLQGLNSLADFIYRNLDLTGATSATITWDYDISNLSNNRRLALIVWDDVVEQYVDRVLMIKNTSPDTGLGVSYNFTASELTENAAVGFGFTGNNQYGGSAYATIDNIVIDVAFDPRVLVSDVTINEEGGFANVSVRFEGEFPGGFTIDYATLNNTAFAGADYTTTSGTLNFSGIDGETFNIAIPVLDDVVGEGTENFSLVLSNPSDPSIAFHSDALISILDTDPVLTNNQPLILVDKFNGYYNYTTTGGSLRTNNNATDPCSITTTSSNTLLAPIPVTATIEKAYLYWANSNPYADANVTFESQNVTADKVYWYNAAPGSGGFDFYGYVSDVTSIITAIPDPSNNIFDFEDLTIDTTTGTYCGTTVLGGWSLMIFYEDASLPAVSINLYEGFYGLQNEVRNFTLDSFYATGGSGAKATFLSWEGDPDFSGGGETLSITNQGSVTSILSGDGGQTGDNAYNSTIYDNTVTPTIDMTDSYGLDLDTFDISAFLNTGDTEFTANVGAGGDLVFSNAVILKVTTNLVEGYVFEDVNYPGGAGRDFITSGSVGIENVTVELYDAGNNLIETTTTNATGRYVFAGMTDGNYNVRVVNSTVRSTRGGGSGCTGCFPVQTFRSYHDGTSIVNVTGEVGGSNPATQDVAAGSLTGAQSVSSFSVSASGVAGIDFGFNFNTIVNTNASGQGSLAQFIENANNLDQSGLDIESNSIFDPQVGEDTSIFMIPPLGDSLGRTADVNFSGGVFSISQSVILPEITGINTHIDGRTQTAYSGNTNTLSINGGDVGVSATTLTTIEAPEIEIEGNTVAGDILRVSNEGCIIRNMAVYSINNQNAINIGGTINTGNPAIIEQNFIGVDADNGAYTTNTGIIVSSSAAVTINTNYIARNTTGTLINGGTQTVISDNYYFTNNPDINCSSDAITLQSGAGITIENNLIENSGAAGIDMVSTYAGNTLLNENTIKNSGQSSSCTATSEIFGISVAGNDNILSGNIINDNGGAGIIVGGSGTGNLITQNSIFNNGVITPALGIDLNAGGADDAADGITLNDLNDTDGGVNSLINFPVIEIAVASGGNLHIKGWAPAGSTLEFFLTDVSEGTATLGDNRLGLNSDYGEGQTYLNTFVEGDVNDLDSTISSYSDSDGNTDNTNRFYFQIPSAITNGAYITTTATLTNNTSEYSPSVLVKPVTVITNRQITYRVKPK